MVAKRIIKPWFKVTKVGVRDFATVWRAEETTAARDSVTHRMDPKDTKAAVVVTYLVTRWRVLIRQASCKAADIPMYDMRVHIHIGDVLMCCLFFSSHKLDMFTHRPRMYPRRMLQCNREIN